MLADKYLRDELNKFAKYVIQQSRSNLTKGKKNASKELYNSLGFTDPTTKNGTTSFSFTMADYGVFQDRGVKGTKSNYIENSQSPYRFGTGSGKKGGLRKSMKDYVKRKGIQFRDKKTGRFLSYESTAYLISRSIYHKGTKASLFFTKPFEAAFKRLPDELVQAYSIGLEKQIQVNINK